MTGEIGTAKLESDFNKDDHAFRVVDDVLKASASKATIKSNEKVIGRALIGQNIVWLDKGFDSRTAAHEIGHSTGLYYPKDMRVDKMNKKLFNGITRKEKIGGTVGIINGMMGRWMIKNTLTSNNFRGNLMHQARDKDKSGNGVAGYKLNPTQVIWLQMAKRNQGNQGTPKK